MNKLMIGVLIVLVGGVAGWYFFRSGGKFPGMQIGKETVIPAPSVADENVTITEESPVVGSEKGGVIGAVVVTYTDNGYAPSTITVKKGTTVIFRNNSTGMMWTASGVHPTHQLLPGFDELKSVANGGTYEYTFAKVGKWQYHNHVNASDQGYVIVTE